MANEKVKVQRTLVVEYEASRDAYPDMTDEQIIAFENGDDGWLDVDTVFENIKSEQVVVTFTGGDA